MAEQNKSQGGTAIAEQPNRSQADSQKAQATQAAANKMVVYLAAGMKGADRNIDNFIRNTIRAVYSRFAKELSEGDQVYEFEEMVKTFNQADASIPQLSEQIAKGLTEFSGLVKTLLDKRTTLKGGWRAVDVARHATGFKGKKDQMDKEAIRGITGQGEESAD